MCGMRQHCSFLWWYLFAGRPDVAAVLGGAVGGPPGGAGGGPSGRLLPRSGRQLADIFLPLSPGYLLAKCAFLVWCMAPVQNNGANLIFTQVLPLPLPLPFPLSPSPVNNLIIPGGFPSIQEAPWQAGRACRTGPGHNQGQTPEAAPPPACPYQDWLVVMASTPRHAPGN